MMIPLQVKYKLILIHDDASASRMSFLRPRAKPKKAYPNSERYGRKAGTFTAPMTLQQRPGVVDGLGEANAPSRDLARRCSRGLGNFHLKHVAASGPNPRSPFQARH
ncbi:hypothetical protein MES5069_270049 [Mesorhizobium escarrei]|uniref:Uncharacterized protein n=1 Tax=Mesorhizobium escarrei TaxID=666018 RepID=A0ABM9DVP4_9HYPH|nr:hypothetical protein MES5069_270049 [Mesorhizobium escarrei]